jgi:hypothetical protein
MHELLTKSDYLFLLRSQARERFGSLCPFPTRRRAWLYMLRKNLCFVSGHDFSRAVKGRLMRALAPGVRLFSAVFLLPKTGFSV